MEEDKLVEIDSSTGGIINTIELGIYEYDGYYASSGLVVDAGTDTLYVSTAKKGIVPVDGRTGTVRERIEAGGLMALDRVTGLVYAVKAGYSSEVTVSTAKQTT